MTESEIIEYKKTLLETEDEMAGSNYGLVKKFTRFPYACCKILTPYRLEPKTVPNDRELISVFLLAYVNEGMANSIPELKKRLGKFAHWADDPELVKPAADYIKALKK